MAFCHGPADEAEAFVRHVLSVLAVHYGVEPLVDVAVWRSHHSWTVALRRGPGRVAEGAFDMVHATDQRAGVIALVQGLFEKLLTAEEWRAFSDRVAGEQLAECWDALLDREAERGR